MVWASRSASRTTSWSRSSRTRRCSPRSARRRFTDWREPPIIPASSDWVYGHEIVTVPSARFDPELSASRRIRDASRPGRSRKWRSSTWPVNRRISVASDARSARRSPASESIRARKASRWRTNVSVASTATIVAECGAPSRIASSPKNSPGPRMATIAGSALSSLGRTTLTDPLDRTNKASPGSPWWKIVSPRRNRRTRRTRTSISIASSSAAPNRPHVRRASPTNRSRTAMLVDPPGRLSAPPRNRGARPSYRCRGGSRGSPSYPPPVDTVRCPSCGEENPAKFRLCGFCGTSLTPAPETVRCANCGEENPAKFRLCGFCGTPLAATSLTSAAPAPAEGAVAAGRPSTAAAVADSVVLPPSEVRKFVTLVFTDLKDSTALTGSIDAEAMNEIKARYFRTMAVEIERHGGKVEKNIGDAIMAVFGLIRAHEDDALRAVRAAYGMQKVLAALNEDLKKFYGVQITNRTGVNTGEIVANTDPNADQNLATGDAVNVAARLEQNAPAGEILIGEVTYELVRRQVEVERLDLTLKGKPQPVPAFRLVDVRDAAPSAMEAPAAPFVGREAEMDRLLGAFKGVLENRDARLVTVVGDAGVGKTRLIADFIRRVAAESTVLRGRCLAYGEGITFWPLVEIVRSAARIGEDDSLETARGRIAALLRTDDPDREAIVDRVASAVGLSPSAHPVAELFWGARKLLEAQAAQRPLVIVVDDIHSAETTFLELLDHVVESSRDVPILIVCSARPELADVHGAWLDSGRVERIDLTPLEAADVEAMIDRLLAGSSLGPDTRQRVVAATEGNPLYVEQIVSMLLDHDGGGEVVIPPTISALLAARLDALSRPERAVVDPAAVIGLVFAGAAIEHLVPDAVRPAVEDYLVALDREQFVHPPATDGEEASFRFHPILVRDAAYQSLLKRARATLHERFVEWAEPVNRERGRETQFEEILGYHLEQAVRYRSELGPLDEAGQVLAGRAADKLGSAGRRAFGRGDLPAAANLLRRATALLPKDADLRI